MTEIICLSTCSLHRQKYLHQAQGILFDPIVCVLHIVAKNCQNKKLIIFIILTIMLQRNRARPDQK